MRIDKGDVILDYPAKDMRTLMRQWVRCSNPEGLIQEIMAVSPDAAAKLFRELVGEGFIAKDEEPYFDRKVVFHLTVKGAALAKASAARPLHRALVRQRLHELIERMRRVNEDPAFLVGIEEAVVFGSYLTDTERLGDLDISYKTFRKIEDPRRFGELSDRSAQESGRRFSTILEWAWWPNEQVRLFLKNRSRVYGLVEQERLLEDPTVARRFIFKDRQPIPGWQDI